MSANYIRFLGTGAGDFHAAVPDVCGEDCNYKRALNLGGKNIRRATSMFIWPDIVVDFGETSREQLSVFGIPELSIRHIVISHGHYDHFNPSKILEFASLRNEPLEIYGALPIQTALNFAAAHRWNPQTFRFEAQSQENNCRFHEVIPEKPFRLGDVEVIPVLSSHFIDKAHLVVEQQALNFIFRRGSHTMFYNLDSSYLLPETMDYLSRFQFDILIMDATFGDLKIDPLQSGHHNFAMLDETIEEFRGRKMLKPQTRIVYSHLSTCEVPPHDEVAGKMAEKGIILAYDGMTLEF
jgi:phosphoribosyl 1,2-cyclic phosphate phosphodiesterase